MDMKPNDRKGYEYPMNEQEEALSVNELKRRNIALALEETSGRISVDVEKELNLFHRKRRRSYMRVFIGAAAACLLPIILWIGFFSQSTPKSVGPKGQMLEPICVIEPETIPLQNVLETEGKDGRYKQETLAPQKENEVMSYVTQIGPEKSIRRHLLHIARGQIFKLELPDGTQVFLNAGSRLSYPGRFGKKERVVSLEGEGYFHVASEEKRPFIIQTGKIRTSVLGTEFNLSAYPGSETRLALIEGSVRVECEGSGLVIKPGQCVCVNEEGKMEIEDIDTQAYQYWKEGYFYFDNLPLVDIMKSLARWYNVGILFKNIEVQQVRMHFLADRREGIEHILSLLNRMEKASFRQEGNMIVVE